MNDESRPKAAHETLTKGSVPSLSADTDFTQEDRHASYRVGYGDGMHHVFRLNVDDAVQAALHAYTTEMLGVARRYASVKGPAWTAMIAESGERDE